MFAKSVTHFIILIQFSCVFPTFSVFIPKTKMYYIENDSFLSWKDASDTCKEFGLDLLSVKTRDEFQTLKDYIEDKFGRVQPYWIGAYKDQGVLKWLAYNETIDPSDMMWHEGEPNQKTANELCVLTWENDFDWNDFDCSVKLPFICELQLDA